MNSGCIHYPEWHCNADALKHLQCTVGPLDTSFLSVPKKKNLVVNELSGSLTLPPVYPLSFICSYTTRKNWIYRHGATSDRSAAGCQTFCLHSYVNLCINCVKPAQ